MDISLLTAKELLALSARIEQRLREKKILCSANKPTGDLAERLFCDALDLERAGKSNPHVDAYSRPDRIPYQIKARRIVGKHGTHQLSAIRELDKRHFEFLAAVIFNEDYSINLAVKIPYEVVMKLSKEDKHTNSRRFILRDSVLNEAGVEVVTRELQEKFDLLL